MPPGGHCRQIGFAIKEKRAFGMAPEAARSLNSTLMPAPQGRAGAPWGELGSIEEFIDIVLVDAFAVQGGTVQKRRIALAIGRDRWSDFGNIFFAPDLDHRVDTFLDKFQGVDHLGNALAGDILEITGFEHFDGLLEDIFGRLAIVVGHRVRLNLAGQRFDGFGGL